MVGQRAFAPQFVFAVGSWFVAVDRIQPVAVVLSAGGALASVVSWADLVPAPLVTPWPNRRAGAVGDRVVVQDLPDSPAVTLAIGPDGDARPTTQPPPAELLGAARRPRMWTADPGARGAADPWTFRSTPDGLSWTSRIGRDGAPELPLAGSVVGFAAAGDTAVACVQLADKRPWPFDRRAELQLVSAAGSVITARTLPSPDVAGLGWASRYRDRPDTAALHDYLLYSLRQLDAAAAMGGEDPRLTVRDALTDPRVEIAFRHPDFPGREFVRVDRPFNELGNPGEGLRDLHITLREDIGAGVLDHCAARTNGSTVYC
jgi:hypothetical protein